MQEYSNKITLVKNSRGVYDIDTSKGCYYGTKDNKKGCYGECYAARYSKAYGYNFNRTVLRHFESVDHVDQIRKKLFNIDMPFVRIGVNGDPSEDWPHFIHIVNLIYGIRPIVVITKHWNTLTDSQLDMLANYNLCINTSVSALDKPQQLKHRLEQYNRLKPYCKSVLRVVSCDFNKGNLKGVILNDIQESLFNNDLVLDNVLRVTTNNTYVKMGIINTTKEYFLTKEKLFSKYNKTTYTGNCDSCPDMCGINT